MTSPDKPAPLVHEYKVWPSYFAALLDGSKSFEWRKDDRPKPEPCKATNARGCYCLSPKGHKGYHVCMFQQCEWTWGRAKRSPKCLGFHCAQGGECPSCDGKNGVKHG